MSNINSFTKIHFFTLFIVITSTLFIGSLVSAQEETGEPPPKTPPPIIVTDSCFLNFEDGTQAPFTELQINTENPPVSVECQVINDTEQEVFLDPSITLNTDTQNGEGITLETEDNYILFPNTTSPVLFAFPENTEDTTYDIEVAVAGEFETTTLSTQDLGKEKFEETPPPHVATKQESDFVLYAVVSLLALLVLLAILVYRRKSPEALPVPDVDIDNQEN